MDAEQTADTLAKAVEDQMADYDVQIMDAVLASNLEDAELLLDNRNQYLTQAANHAVDCITKPWIYCRAHWQTSLELIQVFEEKNLEDFTSLANSPLEISSIYTTQQILSSTSPTRAKQYRNKITRLNQGIAVLKAA